MTEFLLARHGQTDWNAERRFQGHADPRLNENGRRQARELAEQLVGAKLDAIYASDLARARETAEIVGARIGIRVVPLRELREIDVGDWQGLTWDDIEARFPDGARRWTDEGHGWTGGETYDELGERVVRAMRAIADERPDGRVLIVVHGGTIRAVRAFTEQRTVAESRRASPAMGHCEVFRIRVEDGEFRGID